MVFKCNECSQSFTRSENLERHHRSRHDSQRKRPFPCKLCSARFSRRDVCKRHMERCARGLHSGKKRHQGPSTEADTSVMDENEGTDLQAGTATIPPSPPDISIEAGTYEGDVGNGPVPSGPEPQEIQPTSLPMHTETQFQYDDSFYFVPSPQMEQVSPLTMRLDQPIMPLFPDPAVEMPTVNPLSPRAVAPHVASYFTHFHAFFPILHKPTFSLSSSPKLLLSAVVAIGGLYSAQASQSDTTQSRKDSHKLWTEGVKQIHFEVQRNPGIFRTPWVLQSWLLYVIYGCFFGDEHCFSPSKNMLQMLVDNIRSLGLFNQDLTFPAYTLWTANLSNLATWDEAYLSQTWEKFVTQETVRICIHALIYIDCQTSSPCNTRSLISTTESNWDLMPSTSTWEATSAEHWFENIQDDMEQGVLVAFGASSLGSRAQTIDRLTLLHATQSLMSGKPAPRLLKRLSRSPFTILSVVANIDRLIRDFTHCYYQMPPGLPDPSAFHVLSQYQNKSVNAALSSLLKLATDGSCTDTNMSAVIQLNCWAARLSLCEPDDLLVSGIGDTTITAGLATSAHLIMGSHVTSRRATASTQRRFGENSSMTVWDDLLRCLALIVQSSRDTSHQEPPWVIILGYRVLLVLWRTLRRAVIELSKQPDISSEVSHYFNPAKIIVSLICERARKYMGEDEMASTTPWEDLPGIQIDYICLMTKIFSKKNASPVSKAIKDIMQEIIALISSEEE